MRFRESFGAELRFLKQWVRQPGTVGAVAPTGRLVARAMAAQAERVGGPALPREPGAEGIGQQGGFEGRGSGHGREVDRGAGGLKGR